MSHGAPEAGSPTGFRQAGGWLTATQPKTRRGSTLTAHLGCPGLWKAVRTERGNRYEMVFELPASVVDESGGDGPQGADLPLSACWDWAVCTAHGDLPAGWQAPSREEVMSWVRGELTVQQGKRLRQGTLDCSDERLALSFPVLDSIPPDLAGTRFQWLGEVLADAQDTWRMVRIGLAEEGEGRRTARAEVDMTGAPPVLLEGLCRSALAGLRWVVQWLLDPAELLADTTCRCEALERVQPG